MQNMFIFVTYLSIQLWLGISQCQIHENAPQLIYPSLNSPFIMRLNDYLFDSNLQSEISDAQNTTLNTTYYQSTAGLIQQIQLYGTIISSDQYIYDQSQSQRKTGTIALLVQNSTGYYVYQVTQLNSNSYNVTFIGNAITIPIVCYTIAYQAQNIIFVSCMNQSQNQAIIYSYDLTVQSQIQPTPYWCQVALQNITNNFISYNYYEEYYLTSVYTSSLINSTSYYTMYQNNRRPEAYVYDGYLTDMIIYNNNQFLLFSNYLNYNGLNFTQNDSLFLKFSIIGFNSFFIYIVTQNNILQLQIGNGDIIQFVDQMEYQTEFYVDLNSTVQIYADNQYVIVSNSTLFLVYEQSNHKLFWKYQLEQQSLIQYDDLNKIITIITQSSIQAFQLYQPQIVVYFDQLLSGKLLLSLIGNSVNCTIELSYQVISIRDPGPYPNQFNQNYQNKSYQESQIQCVSCLFTGQNLTYNQESININHQYYQYQIKNQFNQQDFHFFYAYSNEINPQQYVIFYQLKNDLNLFVIYCGLAYCLQTDDIQTLNPMPFNKLKGYIFQFSIQQYFYVSDYGISLEVFYYANNGSIDQYYSCRFEWFQIALEQERDCFKFEDLYIYKQIFPFARIESINFIGYNIYASYQNPYFIYLLRESDNYGLIYQNYQFVPRQIYLNKLLYNNLLFIDNVYQLNIYELVVNGTQLNLITSIQYPLQQGNTSVGVGLLEKGIVITQIDDQGNQYILFYDPIILRPINLIQQQQPQIVQIPNGAQIQFPVVCSYTNSKFYLVWQYNQNSEMAVFQPSSTINNMLLTSIYIDGQIKQIQSISQGIYDLVICKYNQSKIIQISVWNQFFIQLSSNLLLQNDTFSNVSIVYQAQSQLSQTQIINSFTFINEIFKMNQINSHVQIELSNTYQFPLLPTQFYYGLANNFSSNPNSVVGPIINSNILINSPVPSLFLSDYSNNYVDLFFQNNSGLYQVFDLGQIKKLRKFPANLSCPILYKSINGEVVSVCQSSPTQLIFYSEDVTIINLNQSLTLINGEPYKTFLILNFGSVIQIVSQYDYLICQYTNYDINITRAYIQQYSYDFLVIILQIQGSNDFMRINLDIEVFGEQCYYSNQQRIYIDRSFGDVVYLDFQQTFESEYDEYLVLTVTTTKMVIIYLLNSDTYKTYIVNYSSGFVGIQTQILDDYIIAIYNTTQNTQLNYTVVLYAANQSQFTQFPIAYFNDFYGQPQSFYLTQDGILVYTYTLGNKTGFSYIQIIPYIYVGLNNLDKQTIQINETYEINNFQPQLIIGNQFNSINIQLNVTVTQYLGELYTQINIFGLKEKVLVIISGISIIGFFVFVIFKIMTKNKME